MSRFAKKPAHPPQENAPKTAADLFAKTDVQKDQESKTTTKLSVAQKQRNELASVFSKKPKGPPASNKFAKKQSEQQSEIPKMSGMSDFKIDNVKNQNPRRPSYFDNDQQIQQQPATSIKSDPSILEEMRRNSFRKDSIRSESNANMTPNERAIVLFIQQMNNIKSNNELAFKKSKEAQEKLEKTKLCLQDAKSKDQFEEAEQLTKKISLLKKEIQTNDHLFSATVNEGFKLAGNATRLLEIHTEDIKVVEPQLKEHKAKLDEKLFKLVEEQEKDKLERESSRNVVEQLKETIGKPLESRKKEIDERKAAYLQKVADIQAPFRSKIEKLTGEKESHEAEIKALMSMIEGHRKAIRELSIQISKEERLAKEAGEQLDPELNRIEGDAKTLQLEAQHSQKQIDDADLKLKEISDKVSRRESEIVKTTGDLAGIVKKLDDCEKDAAQIDSASIALKNTVESHQTFAQTRSTAESLYLEAMARLEKVQQEKDSIETENFRNLQIRDSLMKTIANFKATAPQLEASKQQAVASRNFKAAGAISAQIKEGEESSAEAQRKLDQLNMSEESSRNKSEELSAELRKAEIAAEESRQMLDAMDSTYVAGAIPELEELCGTAPFAEKLLSPLLAMAQFAAANARKPKSRAELQKELEELREAADKAAANEDYGEAASLQERAEALEARIAGM